MSSVESDYKAVQNKLLESEKAKKQYVDGKMEDTLSLKVDNPIIVFDPKQVETLDSVLKNWQRTIEDNARTAAQNYVRGALKTRAQDMEAFATLTEHVDSVETVYMVKIDQFLKGLQEAMIDSIASTIISNLAEIKAELQRSNSNLPKENEALTEILRVLKEY